MDTGAGKTLVRGDLVTSDDFVDGEVTIQCAHGDVVSYPLAAVKVTVEGKGHHCSCRSGEVAPCGCFTGLGRARADATCQTHIRR